MKNLIFVISVCAFFSFSIISSDFFSTENKYSSSDLLYSEPTDSSADTPPEVSSPLKDVSGMFNERGYYKSNGFSFDDQEIINDFNGNLIYSVPMYSYALGGDMNLQMKLTYNGSVGHIITASDTVGLGNSTSVYSRRNINFPEWIIDLNGFALQTFNFETNFFTGDGEETDISGSSVNAIITGYHYDSELSVPTIDNHDKINILLGDGSLLTLENLKYTGNGEDLDNYVGDYFSKGKESYFKAIVSYLETPSDSNVGNNPRKVILLKGDGLEYIFEEKKISFEDFRADTYGVNPKIRPMAIYLKEIRDRFSHYIKINYSPIHPFPIDPNEQLMGRQLLKTITTSGVSSVINNAAFWFEYGPSICKVFHQSELNGNYTIIYNTPVGYRSSDNYKNQRGTAGKITNILNQQSEFIYYTYLRRYDQMYALYYDEQSQYLNVSLNDLKRMKSSTTNLGLKRDYQYFGTDSISKDLTTYYYDDNQRSVIGSPNDYKGYGRDPFFANILSKKTDFLNVLKSETAFNYEYSYENRPNSNTFENVEIEPVDTSDSYSTTRTLTSKDLETENNSITSSKSIKQYKVYPVFNPNNSFEVSVDKDGITKLIKDENIKSGTSDKYDVTTYSYEIGDYSGTQNGFDGSFLNKNKKIYPENLTTFNEWSWEYSYQNNDPNKPVIQSTEHDPLGNYSVTDYVVFDTNFWHEDFNIDTTNNYNVKSYFYKINVPVLEKRFSSNGDSLQKKTLTYITDTSSTLGYFGQIISEKIFMFPSFTEYIETSYEYCKNDTNGFYIFEQTGTFPYKEGNLKLIRKNDQETKYFYNPISLSEVYKNTDEADGLPFLKYKVKYNDGTEKDTNDLIWDYRFPIRTDNYKVNGSTRDTLPITYKSYTLDGSPLKMIDQNKYLTQFVYEPIHRINSISLPGDFSTLQDSVILNINHNYSQLNINLSIDGYGYFNFDKDSLFYTTNFDLISYGCCPGIIDSMRVANDVYINKRGAFLFFDTLNTKVLQNYSTVDSMILNLNVSNVNHSPSNLGRITKILIIKKISSSNAEYKCGTCGVVGSPVLLKSRKIISYGNSGNFDSLIPNMQNSFDIKNIISPDKKLNGILFWSSLTNPEVEPPPDHSFNDVTSNAGLSVYGTYDNADTLKIPLIKGGTIKYQYDDVNHKVNVYSVRNSLTNERSRIQYSIDGYGNVNRKDIYTSDTDSNSYKYKFNYMNLPAENLDALDQYAKFSYDGLGRLKETQNADASSSGNSYSYQSGLDYYFGRLSSVIEKQTFTGEEGNKFEKYFDATGNLRRELKFVLDSLGAETELATDYNYDNLYRVTQVRTPNGLNITYSYDGYGRQSSRTTPDAGLTNYVYDNNINLTFSQDANQRTLNTNKYTFRNYDGLNRLTGSGEYIYQPDSPPDGSQFVPTSPDLYLVLNVYDTLSNAFVNIFNPPSDYYSAQNFTKGNLVATAYRTRNTDNWSYKYYRYDERGRVIKMWNIIDGLDGKEIRYKYNSQDQITEINFGYEADYKRYSYYYDFTGRLGTLNYANSDPAIDKSAIDYNFTTYSYNPNSLISFQFFKASELQNQYEYNNRNWITSMNSLQGLFGFTNTYFPNGNVNTQLLFGTYKDNFPQNNYNLYYNFSYDNSNRLLNAINTNQGDMSYSVLNTYDKDGNLTTLKRYGDNNIVTDDFNYQYYSGTNKLSKVSGAIDQYSYDLNGNVTRDTINYNFNIQYDHRNLISELYHTDREAVSRPYTYATRYYYDESGGRVRKLEYFNTQTNPPLITDWDNPGNGWLLYNNEFYVKGADGKDLATYQGSELEDWYVWANDLAGKIRKDKPYYYYKDHLGSVRAVVNENAEIVAAYDYDAWGYPLEGRTFNADTMKFKYTGKELDKESLYEYFGARYYDSRIGRWGQVEPLYDKYLTISPYIYSLNNPIKLIDVDGFDVIVVLSGAGFYKAGQEISPSNYSPSSDIGVERLLYNLQSFSDNKNIEDLDIKGYYSSIGVGEKNEIVDAANFIINNLNNVDEKVILYGYSQGGANIVELANYLNDKGVNVNLLFTVDAYDALSESSGFTIPENTKENYNYFQFSPDALTGARGTVNRPMSSKTRVRNKLKNNSSHNSIDEDTSKDILRIIYNKIE